MEKILHFLTEIFFPDEFWQKLKNIINGDWSPNGC